MAELKICSFNLGLLRVKVFGLTAKASPPYVAERFKQIPAALCRSGADIVFLQEIYEEAHVEALLAAFLERAGRLQNAFAAAAMQQEAGLGGADDDCNPAALRAEVEALRTELADKESLLTAHRTNVQRWLAECQSVADHTNSTAP